jgi:diguanylate cyclase (GGDEF)-like protein
MTTEGPDEQATTPPRGTTGGDRDAGTRARRARTSLQTVADADQTLADADQTASDEDQTAAAGDQADADADQEASDRDQATSDRDHETDASPSSAENAAYEMSRSERDRSSFSRVETRKGRGSSGRDRDATAGRRDRTAESRDHGGDLRDAEAGGLADREGSRAELLQQLADLRARASAERTAAAADRAKAAAFRAAAAEERSRLEAELRSAHLDHLTGAFRREMGTLALEHGIDRARRSDQRFVVAFVDVDRLKSVNDVEGHAAGDHVLQVVAHSIRARLRSFDPVIRYGGDEFICGLGGTDIDEARRRFDRINGEIQAETGARISVGFASLAEGDTVDAMTRRADEAMLRVKVAHRAGDERRPADPAPGT